MVKLLDLRVCDAEVKYDGIYSGRCGYACLDLAFKIKLKLYVKYEIARWTYHDKLVIKYWLEPAPSPYEFGRAVDKEVMNPSDQSVVKEEIIDTMIYAVVSYCDMRKSGYKSFTVRVYGENWACMNTLNISFYWNASNCTVSNVKVSGIKECPMIIPEPVIIREDTRLRWNGKDYKPGTYTVPIGTRIDALIKVRNEGSSGRIKVIIWDSYKNEVIFSREIELSSGTEYFVGHAFTMDRYYALKVVTYYYDPAEGKFKKYDEYG